MNHMTYDLLIELFPPGTRSTASAIGYSLGAAIVAGPGPLIAAALALTGAAGAGIPAACMVAVAVVATFLLWRDLPETGSRRLSVESSALAADTLHTPVARRATSA